MLFSLLLLPLSLSLLGKNSEDYYIDHSAGETMHE